MARNQKTYLNNMLSVKYPLDYTELSGPQDSLLADAVIESSDTNLKFTAVYNSAAFFSAVVEGDTGPVGTFSMAAPSEWSIIQMDSPNGLQGHLVLGPGAGSVFGLWQNLKLDPMVQVQPRNSSTLTLKVNGFEYDFPPVLKIVVNSYAMLGTEIDPDSSIDNPEMPAIIRNDADIPADLLKYSLDARDFKSNMPIFRINDINPDTGIVTLQSDDAGITFSKQDTTGVFDAVLVDTDADWEACADPDLFKKTVIKKGTEGFGTEKALPLDKFVTW
ncbi:MAG: hypothetical protein PHT95_00660 [Candidatus Omnitrophica bacterium]|nr:hypothetical protein [Candidatus Omnitrophota bacterium]